MNKIYRVIWNHSLNKWIVTSELGRGKIKSATSKVLSCTALSFLLSSAGLANECDAVSLICETEKVWSSSNNNFNSGGKVVSDGMNYTVLGPEQFKIAQGSLMSFSNVNDMIEAGYINAPLISENAKNYH
ncbi:hypothetical protein CWR41_00350 [Cedecea lapagei]|nr:hypothetical protein CWR41_00350 [Cedecea lapagei]